MAEESRAIYEMGLTPGTGYVAGPEGLKAQNQAIETGKEQCHRSIVNIVGKERQGKTSLRKALSRQNFDPNEVSTVGIDHDLVDANCVNDVWEVIDNMGTNEFEEAVGEHTLRILAPKALSKTHKKAFHYAKTMIKIFFITSTKMVLYYVGMKYGLTALFPWFAFLLIGTFGIAALEFGVRDGFGIAIGIYALAVLSDAVIRWRIHESMANLSENYGALIALVASFLIGAVTDSFIGVSFGASLGTGMAISLCVMIPPSLDVDEFTFLCDEGIKHIFLFMIGTLVGLGSHKETGFHSYFIVPVIAIIHEYTSSRTWLYTFILGLGLGITHGNGLSVGRQLYVSVFGKIKAKFGKQGWRFFTYTAGIPSGLLLALLCGWGWPSAANRLQYVFAILFIVMVELLHIFYSSGRTSMKRPTETAKSSHVIKAHVMPRKRTELTIRDFAGHPLYHFAHHIFMYSQSIYIIVFNLQEAVADIDATFKTILYWLNSIDSHAEHPNASIFIVGTHRDSVCPNERANVAKIVTERLPRKYHNIVVWNDDGDSALFQVENSVDRSKADKDLGKLRHEVWSRARNAEYMKKEWPIKFWAFLNEIRAQRQQGVFIGRYNHFLELVLGDSQYKIRSQSEFKEMLAFFQNIGEIIYQGNDDTLEQVIVFAPQFLVDVMAAIVSIPPVANQEYGYKDQWHELKETGICRQELLGHVIKSAVQSQSSSVECDTGGLVVKLVLEVLESNDLICKIAMNRCQDHDMVKTVLHEEEADDKREVETLYAIPKLLPSFNQNEHLCEWESNPNDVVLFVNFGLFHPGAVFLRLLCQCLRHDHRFGAGNGDFNANMFSDFGSFHFSDDIIYKLRLLKEENAFEIVIRSTPRQKPMKVACILQERIHRIIKRDFEKCLYTMGPKCPCQTPHDIPKINRDTKNNFHVLKMFSTGSKVDLESLGSLTFWCNGRRVQVRDGKAYQEMTPESGSKRTTSRSVRMNTHVMNLPHDLYRYICTALNVRQTLGTDWTGLAAVMGKTALEVNLLSMESNPCDALLKDWGTSPDAIVGNLLEFLEDPEMTRCDIVSYIHDRLL